MQTNMDGKYEEQTAKTSGQTRWRIPDVVSYGERATVNGLPQFGFHDRTGACYRWNTGKTSSGCCPMTRCVDSQGGQSGVHACPFYNQTGTSQIHRQGTSS